MTGPRLTIPATFPPLAPRAADSHKGSYGHILLIGGSRGMAGAMGLAGQAALRSGSGLVTLAVPAGSLDAVAGFEPSYMTFSLPETDGAPSRDAVAALTTIIDRVACVGIGPGLGTSRGAIDMVSALYASYPRAVVVDADALNGLAATRSPLSVHAGPRVLTPHPGEFRRLVDRPNASIVELREIAPGWAAERDITLVLKGHQTLVTRSQDTFTNSTGNPGMATGGTGDVLTGVITSLLGQGLSPWDAARWGVFAHGHAGDLAALRFGERSMIARDLIEHLPNAWMALEAASASAAGPTRKERS